MKLAKTVLSCVVALALVATMAVCALASDGAITIAASADKVAVGDTFTVTVYAEGLADMASGALPLTYDTAVVEFVDSQGSSNNQIVNALPSAKELPTTAGVVNHSLMMMDCLGSDDKVDVYTITFKAIAEGDAAFNIADGELDDCTFTVATATVTVAAVTEAPATEAPATEAPATEAPATDAPATAASEVASKENELPKTGADASMAIVAGLVVLAGAAFVASKKSK